MTLSAGALVSVIIPTYNRHLLVTQAIESVLAQSYRPVEIIVVDDGSTDDTERIEAEYGSEVRYLRIRHSGLPATARNVGVQAARGDYIAFLDSDDLWLPEKLLRQMDDLTAHPSLGLVCSNALVVRDGELRPSQPYFPCQAESSRLTLGSLLLENVVITSTVLLRRSVLDRVGLFSQQRPLRAVEDYDLWLRVSAVSEVLYVPEPLAVYRDQKRSLRSEQSPSSYWRAMVLALARLRHFLRGLGVGDAATDRLIQQLLRRYYFEAICAEWAARDCLAAAKDTLMLLRMQPLGSLGMALNRLRKRTRSCPRRVSVEAGLGQDLAWPQLTSGERSLEARGTMDPSPSALTGHGEPLQRLGPRR